MLIGIPKASKMKVSQDESFSTYDQNLSSEDSSNDEIQDRVFVVMKFFLEWG